jgi:pectinesterase
MSQHPSRRDALTGALALPFAAPTAQLGFDASVGTSVAGAPRYASLTDALTAAQIERSRPFRIFIGPGEWREKLIVDKPHIHLIGAHRNASVIVFGAAAGHARPGGEPYGTRGCATLTVRAPGFRASNLTIANDFDYIANLTKMESDPTRLNDPQGVALMLDEGSDRALVEDVNLVGHQDTLFIDAGLSLFKRCRVEGSVDFVFGAGRSLLTDCEIVSRHRPHKPRQGYITAPTTPESQPFGLVFDNCRLMKETAVPASSVVLGRPWRPSRMFADGTYGDPKACGHAAFLRCWMDDHVSADGWDPMRYTTRAGERIFLEPERTRLFEYASTGPGARHGPRRRMLTAEEAARYTPELVLDNWRVE